MHLLMRALEEVTSCAASQRVRDIAFNHGRVRPVLPPPKKLQRRASRAHLWTAGGGGAGKRAGSSLMEKKEKSHSGCPPWDYCHGDRRIMHQHPPSLLDPPSPCAAPAIWALCIFIARRLRSRMLKHCPATSNTGASWWKVSPSAPGDSRVLIICIVLLVVSLLFPGY